MYSFIHDKSSPKMMKFGLVDQHQKKKKWPRSLLTQAKGTLAAVWLMEVTNQ